MDVPGMHRSNRAAWEEAATRYVEQEERDVEFLRSGGVALLVPELRYLEDPGGWCGRAVHLQCAAGLDTLSLLNLGAGEVVGVDISSEMVESARRKSEALGAQALWYACDVLETPRELDRSADLVYTGKGALNWLHDIEAWTRVVERLLKPGGWFYLFEEHPITWIFDPEASEMRPHPEWGYFSEEPEESRGWTAQYIGELSQTREKLSVKYERQWTLGAVVNALVRAGLRIESLEEHSDRYWRQFPELPASVADRFPHTYSLLARKA